MYVEERLDRLEERIKTLEENPAKDASLTITWMGADTPSVDLLEGVTHSALPTILRKVACGCRTLMLCGPAGSGKTTLARDVSRALDVPFYRMGLSGGVQEYHILGSMVTLPDGSRNFAPSGFLRGFTKPGVSLFSELDAADPNVLVSLNLLWEPDGYYTDPSGTRWNRHPEHVIVADANTCGRGADRVYVGRNQLDGATLDRFGGGNDVLYLDYDEGIETTVCNDIVIHGFVKWLRERVREANIRRPVSTRLLVSLSRDINKGGKPHDQAFQAYLDTFTPDEKRRIGEFKP
jgi:MoxR-like ATPase